MYLAEDVLKSFLKVAQAHELTRGAHNRELEGGPRPTTWKRVTTEKRSAVDFNNHFNK